MSQAQQECHKLCRFHNITSSTVRIPQTAKLNSSKVSPEGRGGCGQNQPTTRLSKTGMSQAQTVRIPQTAKLNSKIPQIAALVDYKQSSINQPVSQQTQPLQQTLYHITTNQRNRESSQGNQ
jgi:virulence-associated protein VagC